MGDADPLLEYRVGALERSHAKLAEVTADLVSEVKGAKRSILACAALIEILNQLNLFGRH